MTLPFGPPLKPMLAKLRESLPEGDGWIYDPKWDGFRALVFRDGDDVEILSRNGRPLNRYFPEVVDLVAAGLPDTCVVDGEIIMPTPEGLEFDVLQLRLHPAASRVEKLARETPASFVAFDLLALGSDDLRGRPLAERWRALVGILGSAAPERPTQPATDPGPRLWLTPTTTDPEEASRWFEDLERVGLDGVIAKRTELPYAPGERVMVKVKHRRTADCVVGGYRVHKSGDGVGSLLLGLYEGDVLHYVGHTSSFKAKERREVQELLKPYEGKESFGGGRAPGGPSRWSAGKDTDFVSVAPELVCEVSYDYLQGDRFRHAATFVRWRDDKEPRDCTWDQLSRGR